MMKVGQACPDLPEDLYKKFEQWWIMQSSAIVPKIQPSVLPQSVRDMFYRNGSSPRHSSNVHDHVGNCIVPKAADPKAQQHGLQVTAVRRRIFFANGSDKHREWAKIWAEYVVHCSVCVDRAPRENSLKTKACTSGGGHVTCRKVTSNGRPKGLVIYGKLSTRVHRTFFYSFTNIRDVSSIV